MAHWEGRHLRQPCPVSSLSVVNSSPPPPPPMLWSTSSPSPPPPPRKKTAKKKKHERKGKKGKGKGQNKNKTSKSKSPRSRGGKGGHTGSLNHILLFFHSFAQLQCYKDIFKVCVAAIYLYCPAQRRQGALIFVHVALKSTQKVPAPKDACLEKSACNHKKRAL